VGAYRNGVIKYACKSVGYTAWWQRKSYFTFLTLYILVIPAILITYCYVNVVRVVWQSGKQVRDVMTWSKVRGGRGGGRQVGSGSRQDSRQEETASDDRRRLSDNCEEVILRRTVGNVRSIPRTRLRTVQVYYHQCSIFDVINCTNSHF